MGILPLGKAGNGGAGVLHEGGERDAEVLDGSAVGFGHLGCGEDLHDLSDADLQLTRLRGR